MKFHELLSKIILYSCLFKFVAGGSWWSFNVTSVPNGRDTSTDICNSSISTNIESETDSILVKCICDMRRKTADCSDKELISLPSKISFPIGIQIGIFKDNGIIDIKDDNFYNGKDIIELDLSRNEIDFISVRAFLAFPRLQRLLLNHNHIWMLPPSIFDELKDLRALDLSYNALKLMDSDIFKNLIELRELKLEANPLGTLPPKQFEHLSKLEFLDLESILLQNVSDHLFIFTPKLKVLSLANNQLSRIPTQALKTLKNLKSLDLSGNLIDTIEPYAFYGMEKLVRLHLNRMPSLKAIKEYAFSGLERLRDLQCSYNYLLSDIDDRAFIEEVGGEDIILDQLVLQQNKLETLSPNLMRWTDSMELHIGGNPWNCDCRAQWLLHVKLKNNFQADVRCASPSNLRGRALNTLKPAELSCELPTGDIVYVAGLSAIALIILLVIIGCFIYKRNVSRYQEPHFKVFKKSDVDEIVYERSFRP